MLVPNQFIEVKIGSSNFKHYRELGYDIHKGDIIMVPPEHLTDGSHAIIKLTCDICGESVDRIYKDYIKCRNKLEMDVCKKCGWHKEKKIFLEKYGCEFPMQCSEIKEKQRSTFMDKYGGNAPMCNENIRQKTKMTNIKKYGVSNPMQNPEIREKAITTMSNNGTVKTSSQQFAVYEMVKNKYPTAEINYPYSTCALDIYICINDIKVDIEYDCKFFHNQQKDIKRDKFLQSQGFKTLRIRSGRLLPTEEELFDAIDYLITTEHHFKEIILSDWKEGEKCQEQLQAV